MPSGPVVFISHFRASDVDAYATMAAASARMIEAEKPRTAGFLHFLDREAGRVTIVHLFADADAMDQHFVGSDERSSKAIGIIEPESWEIFGPASESAVSTMRREAAAAGVPLTVQAEYVDGFLRLTA